MDDGAVGEQRMLGLRDVPDGLVAWAQPVVTAAGPRTDRLHRQKFDRLRLRAAEPGPPVRPEGLLGDPDWKWAVEAPRYWGSVVRRFGPQAEAIAEALARAGCVELEHDFRVGALVRPAKRWVPHESLLREQAERKATGRTARAELSDVAARLRRDLGPDWPGVAASFSAAREGRLLWTIRAAQDLLEGRSHDGARAFVQAHAGDTKAREDLPNLLRELGWEARALTLIGVSRSPYLGISGPLRARSGLQVIDVTGWPGPHDLRLTPEGEAALELTAPARHLLVIENRQAAEALADEFPGLPVIWCHGQPPARALDLVGDFARACHDRGHRVEQEAAIRSTVRRALL